MIQAGKAGLFASLVFSFLFATGCSNSNGPSDFSAPLYEYANINFNINLPAHANKKFSAYVFTGGVLKGAVLSNTTLDASGKYYARTYKVDGNNCITDQIFKDGIAGTYAVHYRVDSTGSASFVSPSGCPSSAGFLSDAGLGMDFTTTLSSGNVTFSVTSLNTTSQVTFNISGTGLNAVSRNTYCSIVDAGVSTPTIYTTSMLGFSQGPITYSGGVGTAISTPRAAVTTTSNLGYACWIDADGGNVYNSGDLVASGALTNSTTAISTWTTVP